MGSRVLYSLGDLVIWRLAFLGRVVGSVAKREVLD